MIRLDALLHLAAIYCRGTQPPTIDSLNRWLNQMLAGTAVSRREDPAEDLAIGNIMTATGNYRVFLGDSSNPDYYAQDVLDALRKAPAELDPLREECQGKARPLGFPGKLTFGVAFIPATMRHQSSRG